MRIGNIINNRKTYLSGAPRSKDVGQVFLFQQNDTDKLLDVKVTLTGDQFGSYFGHDLAVGDFNGDGYVLTVHWKPM